MLGTGDMKGWQAVPIVIPSFLILSIGTIWYFSFHHFKDRPRQQNLTSPMNSLPRSEDSGNMMAGPPNPDHLVHLVDIPPVPTIACSKERRHGSPAPGGALRAQRSRGNLQSAQNSGRTRGEDNPDLTDRVVNSDGLTTPTSNRSEYYVVDSGTPPPIPAAHLRAPVSDRHASERPVPLTPMSTLPSDKKNKAELRANFAPQATCSSACSQLTASGGPANEIDSTMVAEQSVASTESPSPGALGLPNANAQSAPHQTPMSFHEPKKIFVVKQNPNSICPSIKCEPNPAAAPDPSFNDLAEEIRDQASTTSGRSHAHSLTMSIRSFLLAHPSPSSAHITDHEYPYQHHQQPGLSISGPSLYTFERRSPDWCITESDVYRNASRIPNPLIDHPDLEKGFQRPKEWGEKTPDLIEAEIISGQMRRIDQLKQERLGKLPAGQGG